MPISEDEYDYHPSQESQVTMSKAELRKVSYVPELAPQRKDKKSPMKTHKPIMEKRRRARINHCLNEIKTLILEAMNKDPSRHSKLEKADILEMAVKHLQNVQRQQLALAMATDPTVLRKFKTGFNECASEIDRYVTQAEGVESGLKDRMRSHLQKCINGIEQVAHFNFPGFSNLPFVASSGVFSQNSNMGEPSSSVGDQNNNATRIQIPQSIQLIPSRLPSGEIALLLPNSNNLPFLPNLNQQPRERPSAFAAVVPSSSATSSGGQKPSPESPERGFRPVQPSNKPHTATLSEEPQVPQVSSTSIPLEVKTVKYPIHKMSPRKTIEPLCIITNQSERYKQAQTREDSIDFVENQIQGVKRKYSEVSHGLLTLAPQDYSFQAAKVTKTDDGQNPSTSKDSGESSDMWRPW